MNTKNYLNLKLEVHILYWIAFLLFFTLIWGTYDNDYERNFMIQLFSLPSRLVLVYGTLFYLFPKLLLQEKYLKFILYYTLLLVTTSFVIQRPIIFYFIQNYYLPFQSTSFFAATELMNTVIDVNLAAIIPLGYAFIKIWQNSRAKNTLLQRQNHVLLEEKEDKFIYLRSKSQVNKILLKDIVYIESLKNYIKVNTIDDEIMCHKSISSMQEILPAKTFLRVHRSFIVSLNFINSFSSKIVNLKGNSIPIGRKYRDSVKEVLEV